MNASNPQATRDDGIARGYRLGEHAVGQYRVQWHLRPRALVRRYHAIDTRTGENVVLCEVRDDCEQLSRRIVRSATLGMLARDVRIATPKAVHVLPDGRPLLVFSGELARSLEDLYDGECSLARGHVLGFVREIADAMASCHDVGLVHGGLHPRHVFPLHERRSVEARIEGLRVLTRAAPRRPWVGLGESPGAFAAPETARSTPTPKSDVYGIGALLFYVLTGPRVFRTYFGARRAPTSLLSLGLADEQLSDIVDSCLAIEPSARPELREIVERIDGWASLANVEATPDTLRRPTWDFETTRARL